MKLTKATDEQIKELFAKMIVLTDGYPIEIERNEKTDEIYVTFTTTWETREGEIDIEDTITLSKDTLSETDFPCEDEMLHLYKQWLVAMKFHSLFDNNPFIKHAHPTEKGGEG